MTILTYYIVLPFDRDENGKIQPGQPHQVQSAEAAINWAATLALSHAGVVAFCRTGDPVTGKYEDAVLLSQAGEVHLSSLRV